MGSAAGETGGIGLQEQVTRAVLGLAMGETDSIRLGER